MVQRLINQICNQEIYYVSQDMLEYILEETNLYMLQIQEEVLL